MKIDWKRKLSSRKFWAAIVAVAISIFAIFGIDEATTAQLTGIITAVGSLVIYMLAESNVDAASVKESDDDAK